jgi:16S rRNA (cytosine967-C5)-methyltransferase
VPEHKARLEASRVLELYDQSPSSVRAILREADTQSWMPSDVRPMVHSLTLGVIRFLNTIDFLLVKALGHRKLSALSPRERTLLRLALYESRWVKTPLELVKEIYLAWVPQLISVFETALFLDLQRSIRNLTAVERYSIRLSHPSFLVRTLLDNLPSDEAISLMEKNNTSRDYFIRVNRLKADDADAVIQRAMAGVDLEPDHDLPGLFLVRQGIDAVVGSDQFKRGEILIQDKASVVTAVTLDPRPGDTVWDACASPGMKTQLIWEMMNRTGRVVATDVYTKRARIGRQRSELLGCREVEWLQADASRSPVMNANKILIDAPCTSTGVLRSHPSFKWRLNKSTLLDIMSIQNKILDGVLTAYSEKPGTEIVYATCSLLPHEGESQIDSAMTRHRFELVRPPIPNSPGYPNFRCSQSVCRLFPHRHSTNGFFIAHLRITR